MEQHDLAAADTSAPAPQRSVTSPRNGRARTYRRCPREVREAMRAALRASIVDRRRRHGLPLGDVEALVDALDRMSDAEIARAGLHAREGSLVMWLVTDSWRDAEVLARWLRPDLAPYIPSVAKHARTAGMSRVPHSLIALAKAHRHILRAFPVPRA